MEYTVHTKKKTVQHYIEPYEHTTETNTLDNVQILILL